jgi:hypothetical protein
MHNAWIRAVAGRLESRYRYSNEIVYNNFPWPDPTNKQYKKIEKSAQKILNSRENYPDSTLADLYDPLTMPTDLYGAHKENDRAVDLAYGCKGFATESDRVGFLFEKYKEIIYSKDQN